MDQHYRSECVRTLSNKESDLLQFAVSAENGNRNWAKEPPPQTYVADSALSGSDIFVIAQCTKGFDLIVVDIRTRSKKHLAHLNSNRLSMAVRASNVLLLSDTNILQARDRQTGRQVWSTQLATSKSH